MAINHATQSKDAIRKRRTHKKSRQGCANCKLRRVKCDEAKPKCCKCIDYGVDCSYGADLEGELQLALKGMSTFDVPLPLTVMSPSVKTSSLNIINRSLTLGYQGTPVSAYQLSAEDFQALERFQTRTVFTIGNSHTRGVYLGEVVRLASCNPFLMHFLLTLTLMHDRYLDKAKTPSIAESFHWYQGTALFNKVLSRSIKPSERDAVWASAGLLGAVAFSSLEVTSPEEAWPLRSSTSLDLNWLLISDGKKEIVRLAYPTGPDSVFYHASCAGYINILDKIPDYRSDFQALPDGFIELLDLGPSSSLETNPYHRAAAMLNELLPMDCNYTTIMAFFTFIGYVPPEYKTLLADKDPKALLLLAYWFAKLCEYDQWWVHKRAWMECQAICIYLRRYHWRIQITKLLKFPITRCGLAGSRETSIKHWIFPSDL